MTKRERSANWEIKEKLILRKIIKPYINIIESKNLSTDTNKSKLKAWTDITEKFNKLNFRHRNKKQIVNQWKLTKLNSGKRLLQYRKKIIQTERLQPPSPSPETLNLVDLPQEHKADCNEFDCDGIKVAVKVEEVNVIENKNNIDQPSKECKFNFTKASFDDMHHFRALENERMQKEHELRVKQMTEIHNQMLINLKLQQQILEKKLATNK